ncbi:MAG: hypothetical protein R3C09_19770 [Pirellulaceae bacterium]
MVDAWLETVSDDSNPASWSPLFSVVQLFRNLESVLSGILSQTLNAYHLKHCCEELLSRLDEGTWLDGCFTDDMPFMREKLRWARERTGSTADDIRARAEMQSFLKAFVAKLEAAQPCPAQLKLLSIQVADAACHFSVIVRAVGELTNDLMHDGHSRSHLHRWVLRSVVGYASQESYLEVFGAASFLREPPKTFEVLFQVASRSDISDSPQVQFSDSLPSDWAFAPESIMTKDARSRYALVTIANARDPYAAIANARATLSRYLWSIKFHYREFDRSLSNHAASRVQGQSYVTEEKKPRLLNQQGLWNSERIEQVDRNTCNGQTFQALDRILYWIEQTRRVEPVAALISEWTAMEFLFSVQGLKDLDAVTKYVPAYLCPNFPRYVLLDFWDSLWQVKPAIPSNLRVRLETGTKAHPGAHPKCNLTKLLEVSLEDESTNPIAALIADYPILKYKWQRIRRLKPGSKSLVEEIKKFNDRLIFDIRTCYRARNTVVHDAVMTVSENLRLLQRLNWMLCSCVDQVIYIYTRNTSLSLVDLHRCTDASWVKWQGILQDQNNICTPEQIVAPPTYFTI